MLFAFLKSLLHERSIFHLHAKISKSQVFGKVLCGQQAVIIARAATLVIKNESTKIENRMT